MNKIVPDVEANEQEWITGVFIQFKGNSISMCKAQLNCGAFCCMGMNAESVCASSSSSCFQPYLPTHFSVVTSVTLEPPGVSSCNPFITTGLGSACQTPQPKPCIDIRLPFHADSWRLPSLLDKWRVKKGLPAFLCPWWSFSIFPAKLPQDPREVCLYYLWS